MIMLTTRLLMPVLLLVSGLAHAEWQLDGAASSVHFVSIKNEAIAESHFFKKLDGSISDAGEATLNIDLASVETGIEIRDQRMREMLFEVAQFPRANISMQMDTALLKDLSTHSPHSLSLPLQLDVHGKTTQLTANLLTFVDADGCLHVLSEQPLLVNASDFALVDGINALREVAGLGSIVTVVPVSVHLQFRPQN